MAVKIGLVGLGFMGRTHFSAYQEYDKAQLVALCDVQPQRSKGDFSGATGNISTGGATQADMTGIKSYTNFDEFLADPEIEYVDICTPTFLHSKFVLAALKAGKHVFSEKPLAINSKEAQAVVRAAAKSGKFMTIGHVLRFWPEYVLLKEAVTSKKYGKLNNLLLRRLSARPTYSWENWLHTTPRSGNAALDLHIHDVDLLQWLLGLPSKVMAQGTPSADGGMDHIITQYSYDSVPCVVAEGGWDFPAGFPFCMAYQAVFEEATIDFNVNNTPTTTIYFKDGRKETPSFQQGNPYVFEIRHFVDCVVAGKKPEVITPAEAAANVALVEAEIKSAQTGKAVVIKKA